MRLFFIGLDCFSAIIFIIPAIIILQYALFKQRNLSKMFMVFIFSFYSMAVFSAVGIPTAYTMQIGFNLNLIPLLDMFSFEYLKNTILNIVLFMPMGFLLPVIWKEYRSVKKTVFIGFLISVIIELLQMFTYRLTDVDDLITNTLGTFLGYYLGKIFLSKLHSKIFLNIEDNSKKYEPIVILITIFLIAFFLQPIVSNKIWDIVLSSPFWESIK